MPKSVIFDCDGVLLDYLGGFIPFIKDIDGVDLDPAGPAEYDMISWLGGTDRKYVQDRILRFNAGELGYFNNLAPLEGAVDAVHLLRSKGLDNHILTSMGSDDATVRSRIDNLNRVFGTFTSITCIDLFKSKLPHLMGFEPSWFIEDSRQNAQDGVTAGHDTLLINAPSNQNPLGAGAEGFTRVETWLEIQDIICGVNLEAEPQ